MLQLLYKYLILNKKVTLPGLGVFYIHRQSASLDFSNKQFIAPSAEIAFTESNRDANKSFYHFIVNEQQIDEHTAVQNFNLFATKLKEELQSKRTVQLAGLGILTKDSKGRIDFKPTKPLTSFYKNVGSERMIRQVRKEDKETSIVKEYDLKIKEVEIAEEETPPFDTSAKKDYWWVFAIIVASIAVAAITYYYYQNGSVLK